MSFQLTRNIDRSSTELEPVFNSLVMGPLTDGAVYSDACSRSEDEGLSREQKLIDSPAEVLNLPEHSLTKEPREWDLRFWLCLQTAQV